MNDTMWAEACTRIRYTRELTGAYASFSASHEVFTSGGSETMYEWYSVGVSVSEIDFEKSYRAFETAVRNKIIGGHIDKTA